MRSSPITLDIIGLSQSPHQPSHHRLSSKQQTAWRLYDYLSSIGGIFLAGAAGPGTVGPGLCAAHRPRVSGANGTSPSRAPGPRPRLVPRQWQRAVAGSSGKLQGPGPNIAALYTRPGPLMQCCYTSTISAHHILHPPVSSPFLPSLPRDSELGWSMAFINYIH